MNSESPISFDLPLSDPQISAQKTTNDALCTRDTAGHCITCSDEALVARVLSVDEQLGSASVTIEAVLSEVDITLLNEIVVGDLLLVHGGVAIATLSTSDTENKPTSPQEVHHA